MRVKNHWRPSINSIYQGSFKPGRGASFCFVHDASLAVFPLLFSSCHVLEYEHNQTAFRHCETLTLSLLLSPKAWLTMRACLAGTAAVMGGREGSEVACGQAPRCCCFVPCHFCLGLDSPIWSVSTNTAINSRAMLRQHSAPGLYTRCRLEVWGCKSHKEQAFYAEIPQHTSC